MPLLSLAQADSGCIVIGASGSVSAGGISVPVGGSIRLDGLQISLTPQKKRVHHWHNDPHAISRSNLTGYVDDGYTDEDDWTKPPTVSADFGPSAPLTIDAAGAAQDIFQSLAGDQARAALGRLASDLSDAVKGDVPSLLNDACGGISIPGADRLPQDVQQKLMSDLASRVGDQLNRVNSAISDALNAQAAGVEPELRRIANGIVDSLQGDVPRAAALLIALDPGHNWREVLDGIAARLPSAADLRALALWLLDEIQNRGGDDQGVEFVVRLVISASREWERRKGDVAAVIEKAKQARHSPESDFALAQDVVRRLCMAPEMRSQPEVLFAVIVLLERPAGDNLQRAGALVGEALTAAAARSDSPAGVLEAGLLLFFASVQKGHLDLAGTAKFLKSLRSDAGAKQLARFMLDHWEQVKSAIAAAAQEQVHKLLKLLAALLGEGQAKILQDVQRLHDFFEGLAQLEKSIFEAPELHQLPHFLHSLQRVFHQGLAKSLEHEAKARNTNMNQVIRDVLGNNLPLSYLRRMSDGLRRLAKMPSNQPSAREKTRTPAAQARGARPKPASREEAHQALLAARKLHRVKTHEAAKALHEGKQTAREQVNSAYQQAKKDAAETQKNADTAFEKWLDLLAMLEDLDRDVWDLTMGGGFVLDHPFTAEAKIHAFGADQVTAGGQALQNDPLNVSLWPQDVIELIGGSIDQSTHLSLLELKVSLDKLKVPHPSETGYVPWAKAPNAAGPDEIPLPKISGNSLELPIYWTYPFNSSVAIAHLPEYWVLDMRYHMPYGDVGKYRVADLDQDGFVRDWEIDKVREAAEKPDTYKESCDCDGDGKVTANDLQLAREQQHRYLNGLMWRPTTTPLGIWIAPWQNCWAFAAIGCSGLQDESIPGKINRQGLLSVIEAQLSLPAPLAYPIRFHVEEREYIDLFENLKLAGLPPPPFPSLRYDVVVTGGRTGRDWQLYATAEPFNPLLRTWKLKATGYARGMLSAGLGPAPAGLAGKGDLRITAIYETKVPLIGVVEEWHDRVEHWRKVKLGDFPVPFDLIQKLMEWTDVPKLCRALLRIGGPALDLLFGWTDAQHGHMLRGVLGYIEQTLLQGWEPGYTWAALEDAVRAFKEDEVPKATSDSIVEVIEGVRKEDDPQRPAVPRKQIAGLIRSTLQLPDAPADGTPEAKVAGNLKALFDTGKDRFAMGLDQLVAQSWDAQTASMPWGNYTLRDPWIFGLPDAIALGKGAVAAGSGAKDVYDAGKSDDDDKKDGKKTGTSGAVPAAQVEKDDKGPDRLDQAGKAADAASATADALPDLTWRKPVYGSIVQFGAGASLYAIPLESDDYKVADAPQGKKGQVVAARVLEDAQGNWWFFVCTEFQQYGWLKLPKPTVDAAFVERKFGELTFNAIAPELLQTVLGPVTLMEMAPKGTYDGARYAGACYAALHGGTGPNDAAVRELYAQCVQELRLRVFGAAAGDHPDPKELGAVYRKISPLKKRAQFWAQAVAWMQCKYYVPILTVELVDKLIPPLMEGKFKEAWKALADVAVKCFHFTPDEARAVSQGITPPFIEVLQTLIDIGSKMRSLKDGDVNFGEGGEAAKLTSKKRQPTFAQSGEFMLRLFVDDEDLPGIEDGKNDAKPGQRPDHDHDICFSFESKSSRVDDANKKAELTAGTKVARPTEQKYRELSGEDVYQNQQADPKGRFAGSGHSWDERDEYWKEVCYQQQVGDDGYAKTKSMSWDDRATYWQNESYRQQVGDDYYQATKDLTPSQREDYFAEVRRRQQLGEDTKDPIKVGDGKHDKHEAKAKIDFGDDTLTITVSGEAGGGAGAGEGAGTGANVSPTGNIKYHFTKPQFTVGMLLENQQALAMAARFMLRFFRHSLHALDVCADYFDELPKSSATQAVVGYLGMYWWSNVFTLFALKEAIADVVADNARFIADFLGKMKFEFEVNALAAIHGEVYASIDVSEAIVGQCSIPLSVILAPVIEFLCATDTTKRKGPSLADRIIPQIEFEVRDAFCGKVGAFPASIEWESHGNIARGKFSIPQGSLLRKAIEDLGKDIGKAADKYKAQKQVKPHFAKLQAVLDAIDAEIKTLFSDTEGLGDAAGAALTSAGPFVADILAAVQGKPISTPQEDATLAPVLAALHKAGTRAVPVAAGELVHAEENDGGKIDISIHVSDAEWKALQQAGFSPPQKPTPKFETLSCAVALPGPEPARTGEGAAIAWTTWRETRHGTAYTGLQAGFDADMDAEKFARARPAAWVDPSLAAKVQHREGRHWAWLDTDMAGKLTDAACPLPDLDVQDGKLKLTFSSVPAGAVEKLNLKMLGGAQKQASTIWELLLIKGGTAIEKQKIMDALAANRGTAT